MLKLGKVKLNLKVIARNIGVLILVGFLMYHWIVYLTMLLGE